MVCLCFDMGWYGPWPHFVSGFSSLAACLFVYFLLLVVCVLLQMWTPLNVISFSIDLPFFSFFPFFFLFFCSLLLFTPSQSLLSPFISLSCLFLSLFSLTIEEVHTPCLCRPKQENSHHGLPLRQERERSLQGKVFLRRQHMDAFFQAPAWLGKKQGPLPVWVKRGE